MSYIFIETAVSFCPLEVIIHKNRSVEGSSAEIVARIGNCQTTYLKI